MKNLLILVLITLTSNIFGQGITSFVDIGEKFDANGEMVYGLKSNGTLVGEFWPVKSSLEFITNQTDHSLFQGASLKKVLVETDGIAIVPGTMTNKFGTTEGAALSEGRVCGDGTNPNWGILILEGDEMTFTHKLDLGNTYNFRYKQVQQNKGDFIHMISIYRWSRLDSEIKRSTSTKPVSKLLVRRETYDGVQIGVVILYKPLAAKEAVKLLDGMNRTQGSKTTHAYVLDGLGDYDQYAKNVNGETLVWGHRDPYKVTNYFIVH